MGSRKPGPFISLERLRDKIRSTFWVVPSACVFASIVLALVLIVVDQALDTNNGAEFFYPGGPAGARSLLSSIVTAMISFTGLVFSITIVVLQLTSGQFSPRVLRVFLRDRTVRFSLGIFIATFVYAMMVQRSVLGAATEPPFVPRIAVSVAFVFVLASVGFFIGYLARIANMIRVATIVTELGAQARLTIERRYGPEIGSRALPAVETEHPHRDVAAPAAGVVVSVNETRLVQTAVDAGCLVALKVRVGDFIPAGAPLCRVYQYLEDTERNATTDESSIDAEILAHVAQDTERTSEQDLAFSFRELVDIAERALSPAVNDPTTACQCVDVIHDLLRRLAIRQLPCGIWVDADAVVRLTIPQYKFADFLDLALEEIWHYGSDAAQVPGRLAGTLADLRDAALPEYQLDLQRWVERICPTADGQGDPGHQPETHEPPANPMCRHSTGRK